MAMCARCGADLAEGAPCPTCEGQAIGSTSRQLDYDASGGHVALELDLDKRAPVAAAPSASHLATGTVQRKTSKAGPHVDPLEAKVLGGFGLPPAKIWEAPAYAKRVKERLVVLDKLIDERRARVERAESNLDLAIMRIATRAAETAAQFTRAARAPYERTIERLKSAEATLRGLEGDRMAQIQALHEKLASIDRRAVEFRREHDAALTEVRRHGEGASAEVKKRLEDAKAKVAIAQNERDAVMQQIDSAPANTPQAAAARKEFLLVCSDFARFVQDDMTTFGTDFDEGRGEIIRLTSVREVAQKELELYVAARGTYDAATVQRASSLIVGAAVLGGLFVLAILAKIVF